jgi:hypothetical protein
MQCREPGRAALTAGDAATGLRVRSPRRIVSYHMATACRAEESPSQNGVLSTSRRLLLWHAQAGSWAGSQPNLRAPGGTAWPERERGLTNEADGHAVGAHGYTSHQDATRGVRPWASGHAPHLHRPAPPHAASRDDTPPAPPPFDVARHVESSPTPARGRTGAPAGIQSRSPDRVVSTHHPEPGRCRCRRRVGRRS